jgi:glycosyltransferase involved in cell wall biosynthesis
MKILLSSYFFHPSVGGIESVSKVLAEKFAAAGDDVHVITQSPEGENAQRSTSNAQRSIKGGKNGYGITRQPSLLEIIRLLRWSDLFFQNNISLRSLIPALILRKPTLVVHQTWLQNTRGGIGWHNRLKQFLLRRVTNVAISKAVADRLNAHSFVIGNPYDEAVFRLVPNLVRDKNLAFVGRLVSDKGGDVLLRALKFLENDNLFPDLTIVGSGPEEENLRRLAVELGLDRQLTFAGQKSGAPLAEILNQHRVLVVPSRWAEPFGIVALEGIACGCIVVGSEKGGLKEAIGPCGVTFENENARALAYQLKRLLNEPNLHANLRQQAAQHLAKFQSDAVAASYLRLMEKLVA